MEDIFYLHCRKCVQERIKSGVAEAGIVAIIFEHDLMILCKNVEHGLIHMQPYVGRPIEGCEEVHVERPRRKIAIGGNHAQFLNYKHEHKLDNRAIVHATRIEHLFGLELKPEDVVRLGPVSEQFEMILKTRFR